MLKRKKNYPILFIHIMYPVLALSLTHSRYFVPDVRTRTNSSLLAECPNINDHRSVRLSPAAYQHNQALTACADVNVTRPVRVHQTENFKCQSCFLGSWLCLKQGRLSVSNYSQIIIFLSYMPMAYPKMQGT